MARIFASFCIWTIFALLPGVKIPRLHAEIRVDYKQISEIPEAEIIVEPSGNHERFSQPPCQFLVRHLAAIRSIGGPNPAAGLNSTTCPVETRHGNGEATLVWTKVSQKWSSLRRSFVSVTAQTKEAVASRAEGFARATIGRQFSYAKSIFRAGNLRSESPSARTYPVNLPKPVTDEPEVKSEPGTDEYWQYYEDCDHWDVIFAIAVGRTHSLTSCLSLPESRKACQYSVGDLVRGMATRNWLQVLNVANQYIAGFSNAIEEQVRIREFRVIECAGIGLKRKSKFLASSLRSAWQNQLGTASELLTQIQMPDLVSQRRVLAARISYPANALRAGNDFQSRYPSLR